MKLRRVVASSGLHRPPAPTLFSARYNKVAKGFDLPLLRGSPEDPLLVGTPAEKSKWGGGGFAGGLTSIPHPNSSTATHRSLQRPVGVRRVAARESSWHVVVREARPAQQALDGGNTSIGQLGGQDGSVSAVLRSRGGA